MNAGLDMEMMDGPESTGYQEPAFLGATATPPPAARGETQADLYGGQIPEEATPAPPDADDLGAKVAPKTLAAALADGAVTQATIARAALRTSSSIANVVRIAHYPTTGSPNGKPKENPTRRITQHEPSPHHLPPTPAPAMPLPTPPPNQDPPTMSQPPDDAITVQTLADWRANGTPHLVLDVREPHELAICALPGALPIPMSEIQTRLAEIPATTPIVTMCHHGARSARVAAFLRQAGHTHVLNLTGGIDAWAVQIDPDTGRY